MKIKNLNNPAFTLLEVLLAAIIFIITIGGLFVTLNAVRAPVAQKETALAAAITGQQVLNYLRSQVSANGVTYYNTPCTVATPCGTLDLVLGPHLVIATVLGPAGISWPTNLSNLNTTGLSYTVNCADGSPGNGNLPSCNPPPPVGAGGNLDQARQVTLSIKNSS